MGRLFSLNQRLQKHLSKVVPLESKHPETLPTELRVLPNYFQKFHLIEGVALHPEKYIFFYLKGKNT